MTTRTVSRMIVLLAMIIAGCATQRASKAPQVVKVVTVAELLPTLSPALRRLLDNSSEARTVLSRALAQTSGARQLRVRYFYRGDSKEPWSDYFHYGPNVLYVGLAMSQTDWDEYVALVFELENSLNSDQSHELWASALRRELSASDYASELLKLEYAALCRANGRLESVSAVEPQLADSQRYHEMIEGTRSYNEFVEKSAIAHDNYAARVPATHR